MRVAGGPAATESEGISVVRSVGEAGDRQPEHGEEQRERKAEQIAHLHVGDPEIALDRPHQKAEHLLVDVAADVGQRQDCDDVPGVAGPPVAVGRRSGRPEQLTVRLTGFDAALSRE